MAKNDPKAYDILQHRTFTGGEVKPLAYVTAQMNCILHGLETPNITFGDTLGNKIADFTERDRVDVIGANPPFGAGANKINQQNFTITTSETALMFMEYFMAKLKKKGRAAIIIKNTFLSNTDNASVAVRRMLLEKCQLNWVLDLPQKVFTAGVHTVVLFFTKDGPTTKPINYYQLDLKGVSLGKTRPLNEADLAEFESLVTHSETLHSALCTLNYQLILDGQSCNARSDDARSFGQQPEHRRGEDAQRRRMQSEHQGDLCRNRRHPEGAFVMGKGTPKKTAFETPVNPAEKEPWPKVRLGDVCEFYRGLTYSKKDEVPSSHNVVLRSNNIDLETGQLNLEELKYISDSVVIPVTKKVERGSILICMANGSKQHLGKVALIESDLGYAFGGFMGLIKPKEITDSYYLYWVLNSYEFKRLIAGLTDGPHRLLHALPDVAREG